MEEQLSFLETIEDKRQEWKIAHLLKDIVVIVLFATLANADSFEDIAGWAAFAAVKKNPPVLWTKPQKRVILVLWRHEYEKII